MLIAAAEEIKKDQMPKIKKRDERIVEYDRSKINNAIWKAVKSVGGTDYQNAVYLTSLVEKQIKEKFYLSESIDVETIQDIVEEILIKQGHDKVAKSYILYRQQHASIRELGQQISETKAVDDYIGLNTWKVKENSNQTFSLQGLNNHISSTISQKYWLDKIYPPEVRNAHNSGDFHIHDLGLLATYCVGWDLKDLLVRGFTGVEGKISSAPAKHFRSLLGQIVNFFYTLQGESAGAQAFSSFDTLIAPYIYYDKLNYAQVKQSLQEFVFNMNVPTRVGFQTPFTNITMDLKVPEFMKHEPAIVGGQMMEKTYGEFQDEMDMLNQAYAEIMCEGDALGRVFTFPIPTYNITEDFEWNNPKYNKIWEMTAKYGIPYFSNFINSNMKPEDVRSMCCRLRIDNTELQTRGGGLFGSNPLTGSIGVVTINLPRLGYLSTNEDDFYSRLANIMDIAKESLEIKRKVIEKLTEESLYPYSKFYLQDIKCKTNQYWANHFSTIGLVGMNEACINLFGEDISSSKGHSFAKDIMYFMRERIKDYQDETGNLYNLEATPAEGCSYTLLLKDNKLFGQQPYKNYTNSTQLPVDYTRDIFTALKHQEPLQTSYTGGTVFHTFLGESPSAEAAKKLIYKMCYQFKLPYYSLTPTFSICPEHGYLTGEHFTCPTCSSECEVYSRVVGYLRPVKQWNQGKQAEYSSRTEFTL